MDVQTTGRDGVEAMLVLSRKSGERILIGDDVAITVVRIGPKLCTHRNRSPEVNEHCS